jgi:hypothetical protein
MPYGDSQTALVLLGEWKASQVEFWVPTGYTGYDISNFGRVRSWWNGSHGLSNKFHFVPGSVNRKGYRAVSFGAKQIFVHCLVVRAFVPNPDCLPFTNHKTGQKSNNWADNLEPVTALQNTQHAQRNGLAKSLKRDAHPRALLTSQKVEEVRSLVNRGMLHREVAAIMGVSRQTITEVIRGRNWSN